MSTNTKGVVLISVMMIMLILSAIGVSLSQNYFLALKRESYVNFENNALQYIGTIEVLSAEEMKKQFTPKRSFTNLTMPFFSEPISAQTDYGTIIANARDASNCFNINSLFLYESQQFVPNDRSIKGFRKLLMLLQYNETEIDPLIDQILDWVDSDDQPRPYGLEDYFYTGPASAVKQYSTQRLFYHTSELLNLPSIDYFDWNQIKHYLCAHPLIDDSGININHLGIEDALLLASVIPEIEITDAESMILDIPAEGFKSMNDLYLAFPSIAFNQTYLPISLTTDLVWIETKLGHENSMMNARTLFKIKNNETIILNRFYNDL